VAVFIQAWASSFENPPPVIVQSFIPITCKKMEKKTFSSSWRAYAVLNKLISRMKIQLSLTLTYNLIKHKINLVALLV
jgi:hypothetical protein